MWWWPFGRRHRRPPERDALAEILARAARKDTARMVEVFGSASAAVDAICAAQERPYARGGIVPSDVPDDVCDAISIPPVGHKPKPTAFHIGSVGEFDPVSVAFAVPTFTTASGDSIMANFPVPAEVVTHVPLSFKSAWGSVVAGPATGSVSTSDPAVVTAELSADGQSVALKAVAPGSASVSYTDGNLSASLSVDSVAPAAASVAFDADKATSEPQPKPEPAAAPEPVNPVDPTSAQA